MPYCGTNSGQNMHVQDLQYKQVSGKTNFLSTGLSGDIVDVPSQVTGGHKEY